MNHISVLVLYACGVIILIILMIWILSINSRIEEHLKEHDDIQKKKDSH